MTIMSRFCGRLKGDKFGFIAVDNFTRDVVREASVFFLTHYHTDHYSGLRATDGSEKKEVSNIFKTNRDKVLYCSAITKRLFISDDNDRIPENQIIEIKVGESVVVTGKEECGENSVSVMVTAVSSGHILGAVMFLFEHEDERALFTGDFRIYPDDIPKLTALHFRNKDIKPISHLYLDTTFGCCEYPKFPLRSEISFELIKLILEWFQLGHVVHINLPYKFAYETLLIDLSKGLNCKIGVDPSIHKLYYSYIPELDNVLFPAYEGCDKDKHKIHAFVGNCTGNLCVFCSRYNTAKTIRPCAMSFKKPDLETGSIIKCGTGKYETYKAVYASHCSFEELKAFVLYLNPKEITTIVNHDVSQLMKVKEQILSLARNCLEVKGLSPVKKHSHDLQINQISPLFRYESSDESAEEYRSFPMDSPPW